MEKDSCGRLVFLDAIWFRAELKAAAKGLCAKLRCLPQVCVCVYMYMYSGEEGGIVTHTLLHIYKEREIHTHTAAGYNALSFSEGGKKSDHNTSTIIIRRR